MNLPGYDAWKTRGPDDDVLEASGITTIEVQRGRESLPPSLQHLAPDAETYAVLRLSIDTGDLGDFGDVVAWLGDDDLKWHKCSPVPLAVSESEWQQALDQRIEEMQEDAAEVRAWRRAGAL